MTRSLSDGVGRASLSTLQILEVYVISVQGALRCKADRQPSSSGSAEGSGRTQGPRAHFCPGVEVQHARCCTCRDIGQSQVDSVGLGLSSLGLLRTVPGHLPFCILVCHALLVCSVC